MSNIYDGYGNQVDVQADINSYDLPIIFGELPKVFITSDAGYTELTKENSSNGTIKIVDRKTKVNLPIKMKLQGAGSLAYAKKNLNITFYNAENKKQKLIFGKWEPTNKIHLKANEYDYSMVRNSVSSRLAYEFMGKNFPNGAEGYIDSFPVIMYYNGEYMGCHTINLPQDGVTYNFKDSDELALKNLAYRCKVVNYWKISENWEYRGSEDETQGMRDKFDALLAIISEPESLTKEIIESHFDVETLIAYIVFAQVGLCVDSLINNWTLVTWDGDVWYHAYYDLDICFGIGGGQDSPAMQPGQDVFASVQGRSNTFFIKVKELYATEIADMYAVYRRNGCDADAISARFMEFQSKWGWQNIKAEREKWGSDKRTSVDASDIKAWLATRIAYLDTMYNFQ